MSDRPVAVIGAGIAGLAATLRLLAEGREVLVFEGGEACGGKMRQVATPAGPVDSGPTVFTMRSVFEELFAGVDFRLADFVTARPLSLLARHAWSDSERLDLHADREQSADAIGSFAGPEEGRGYLAFCRDAGRMFNLLEPHMLRTPKPSPVSMSWRARSHGVGGLLALRPFTSMWRALGDYFSDPRLQQLFGRYATYCGSSPWQAPATLMLIAHLEQEGVWELEGGMQSLAKGLAAAAGRRGGRIVSGEWVTGVDKTADGEFELRTSREGCFRCSAVVCTSDLGALRAGLLGDSVRKAVPGKLRERSLSAVTWSMAAEAEGFPLAFHNVFFSGDYRDEFDSLFGDHSLPLDPTVYLCAQDRSESVSTAPRSERVFCLVNAPAIGDRHRFSEEEMALCQDRTFRRLAACGLSLTPTEAPVIRTPTDFAERFPGSGGAIYGQATHGWRAAFLRPGSRTRMPGLYLAGGGVHPGAGVPMVALSGMHAADSLLADQHSTRRSWAVATAGGTSMH